MFLVLLVGVNYLQADERVTQVDGDGVGQARGEQHSFSLAAAARKASGVESGDRGEPVNGGPGGDAVGDAGPDAHVPVAEVVMAEPGCVDDKDLRSGFRR
jgi:hypothetical protein